MKQGNTNIHDLESQLQILERENETLSTMAEVNLLLYNAFVEIDSIEQLDVLFQKILEHISIILHIPFSGVFICNKQEYECKHSYALFDSENKTKGVVFNTKSSLIQNECTVLQSHDFSFTYPQHDFSISKALLIPIESKFEDCFVLICIVDEPDFELADKGDVLYKVTRILTTKLDTFFFQQRLEQTNVELEKKVAERTKDLLKQNNEYASLNEEYKTLNDELYAAKLQAEHNELRYKEIFDSSIDAIFIHNNDSIEDVNNAMLTMYGYNRTELPMLRISLLSAETYGYTTQKAKDYLQKAETEGMVSFEWYAKKKNGELFWVFVVLKLILIDNKKRVMSIVRDIHQQKLTKEAIRVSEEKFAKAFMASPDSIIISSLSDASYIDVNDTFLKETGYTRDEIIGKSSLDLHIWNSEDDRRRFVKELQKQGNVRNFEAQYKTKTGEIGLVSISAEIIQINEQVCVLSQCKNITESKRTQQENDYRRQVLDTLLANLPIGVFMVEAHTGKPLVANNKACELLGRGILPDANEKNISEVYQACVLGSNEKYPLQNMPIIRAMHGEKLHVEDMVVYRPNGEFSILEIFGAPVYDDSGTLIASLVSFFDISERKKAEKEIADKTKELEQFFTTNLDLLCIADIKGFLIRVNKEWEHVLGYDIQELENHSFLEFVHPDDMQETVNSISQLSNQISVLNFINRYRCKDGSYRWIEWRSVPEGNLIYASARDITERKRVEQELILAKQKAEESDTLKTAFLQNMSHEIRTPLNAIMGFSELLPETFGDLESLQKFSSIIRQRSADLLEIINDILDIAKIESGQLSVHTEVCTLQNVVNEVELFFNEYRVRIKKEHIEFIVSIDPQVLKTKAVIDQIKFKQILINLITNAFKFTYKGYIELGCTIQDSNVLFVYVADTGIGISTENQSRIFKRFVQASTDTTGLFTGTGLGLSIIKGLLNLVGGDIRVTSELDKGSTFYFTYPFEIPSVVDNEEPEVQQSLTQLKLGLRVLVVEDDDFNAQYLDALLNQWKCYVDRVSYGKKAIYSASDKVFDVILMDIRLPDITGYEAAAAILAQNPQQKIIAQTAFAGVNEKNKALKSGFVNYISKPINRQELYTMLVSIKANYNPLI